MLFFLLLATGCDVGGTPSNVLVLGSAANGTTVSGLTIDANGQDYGIKIEGGKGITIERCLISGAKEAGILVRGSADVTIRNCTISGGLKSGIRLSSAASSDNVRIEGNTINGAKQDGIMVAVDEAKNIRHAGLVIIGNTISSVASDTGWPGHYHGMYVQTPGYQISGNRVLDVYDGNGISVRAGGTVLNNLVMRTGKNGISYFADHDSSSMLDLTVSGNRVWACGQNLALPGGSPIALLELPSVAVGTHIGAVQIHDNSLGPVDAKRPLIAWPASPNYLQGGVSESGTVAMNFPPLD